MKTHSHSRRRNGFTLVELLVVITIIAVLASLGFVGASAALNKAREVTALNVASSLESAIDHYYNEYGALPMPEDDTTPIRTTSVAGQELLAILTGNDPEANPKKIRFFTASETSNEKDGMSYVGNMPDALYDPWGQPYFVIMDLDYDQEITVRIPKARIANETIRGRHAIVYSLGKDWDATRIMPKDLVRTWGK